MEKWIIEKSQIQAILVSKVRIGKKLMPYLQDVTTSKPPVQFDEARFDSALARDIPIDWLACKVAMFPAIYAPATHYVPVHVLMNVEQAEAPHPLLVEGRDFLWNGACLVDNEQNERVPAVHALTEDSGMAMSLRVEKNPLRLWHAWGFPFPHQNRVAFFIIALQEDESCVAGPIAYGSFECHCLSVSFYKITEGDFQPKMGIGPC